jgi:hypothetical protein
MIYTDNTNVQIDKVREDYGYVERLKIYKSWLKERNIKYSLVFEPEWATFPTYINLRNEDALVFKLKFGL